jgi:hypothetical protein
MHAHTRTGARLAHHSFLCGAHSVPLQLLTHRAGVQPTQGSISSLETQNASYARLLASTQKSLEERNTAYAALAPKNRELSQVRNRPH